MSHVEGKFEVIDCTFKGGRLQSEILNEVENSEIVEDSYVRVPQSLTPEQLHTYCLNKVSSSKDPQTQKVYRELDRIVEENQKLKAELRVYKLREERDNALSDTTPDDILE